MEGKRPGGADVPCDIIPKNGNRLSDQIMPNQQGNARGELCQPLR